MLKTPQHVLNALAQFAVRLTRAGRPAIRLFHWRLTGLLQLGNGLTKGIHLLA
jgi:hypothetical protein